jgi:hypothetical protein
MSEINNAELAEWIRQQLRAEETRLLAAIYLAREGDPEHAAMVYAAKRKIRSIEYDRTLLDANDVEVMRQIAVRYADRPGYRTEWRSG